MDVNLNRQHAEPKGKQHHHTIGPIVLYVFIRHRCPGDKWNAKPFSGYAHDRADDSFASRLETACRRAYRKRWMVAFNERSVDCLDTLDIQCWQLRGSTDEG